MQAGGQPEFIEPLGACSGVPPGLMEFSSRRTTIRRKRCPTARMLCRWISLPGLLSRLKQLSSLVTWMGPSMSLDTARRVLRIEAQAIQDMMARLDAAFERAVELLFACKGRVGRDRHGQVWNCGAAKFPRRSRVLGRLHFFCIRRKLCTAIWEC